jgi:hypothetical protein
MKKAILGKGGWRKFSKPKVISVATPAGHVMDGQKVEPAASTIEYNPANLRQTEMVDKANQMKTNTVVKSLAAEEYYSNSTGAVIEKASKEEKRAKPREPRKTEKLRSEPARKRSRDLQSGMELLELDFLLSIVEDTSSHEELDVAMRRFNFKELIRRSLQ